MTFHKFFFQGCNRIQSRKLCDNTGSTAIALDGKGSAWLQITHSKRWPGWRNEDPSLLGVMS